MPYRQRKARPTEIHTPWFRQGAYNVNGYPNLSICSQCRTMCGKWDVIVTPDGKVLCYRCKNGVELCKVCRKYCTYGSLDYTHICEDCRNSGRWLEWEDERGITKVINLHR